MHSLVSDITIGTAPREWKYKKFALSQLMHQLSFSVARQLGPYKEVYLMSRGNVGMSTVAFLISLDFVKKNDEFWFDNLREQRLDFHPYPYPQDRVIM